MKNQAHSGKLPSLDHLLAYSNSELSANEMQEMSEHLSNCELCKDALEGIEQVPNQARLKMTIGSLNEQIAERASVPPKKVPGVARLMPYFRVAALFIFLAGAAFLFAQYLPILLDFVQNSEQTISEQKLESPQTKKSKAEPAGVDEVNAVPEANSPNIASTNKLGNQNADAIAVPADQEDPESELQIVEESPREEAEEEYRVEEADFDGNRVVADLAESEPPAPDEIEEIEVEAPAESQMLEELAEQVSKSTTVASYQSNTYQAAGGGDGVVRGKVTDDNDEPLFGVNVTTKTGKGTVTDGKGRFVMRLPAGEHELNFAYVGHESKKQQVILQSDRVSKVDIDLPAEMTALESVEVSGYSQDDDLGKEFSTTHIYDAEEGTLTNVPGRSRASESEPANEGVNLFAEAQANYSRGNFGTAADQFAQVAASESGNIEANFYAGMSYLSSSKPTRAIRYFDAVLASSNALNDNARYYKGIALLNKNKTAEAKQLFEELSNRESPFKSQAKDRLEELD